MATKHDLADWVLAAVKAMGGKASLIDIARYIWENHEGDLRNSGELFYTWQYDMRWAAQELRDTGVLAAANKTPRGIWALK